MSRSQITELLSQLEEELKSLVIAYEQYFIGIEKRSPEQKRERFSKFIRQMLGKYIPQTDLKFRLRGITSRFNSYCGYWDRIMRLIEEGKYERHSSRMQLKAQNKIGDGVDKSCPDNKDVFASLYAQLVDAHANCQIKAPSREQVKTFLSRQETHLKERFGDRQFEYSVFIDGGKPKIKVRSRS